MLELAIPVFVFFLMFIVGASLDLADFLQLKSKNIKVFSITIGQIVLLPLSAFLLVILIQPPPIVASGLLLVSLCPGGAVSNIYSYFAKANVALSVSLTALNGLVSVFLLPVMVLLIFPNVVDSDSALPSVVIKQAFQLILLLFLPVFMGCMLRKKYTLLTLKFMPIFEKIAGVGLFLLLASIFIQFHEKVEEQLAALVSLALIYTCISLIIAYVFSYFLGLKKADEAALVIEFPVRNIALSSLIAVNIFGNSDYLLFGAVFFVIQTPVMLFIMGWYRAKLK